MPQTLSKDGHTVVSSGGICTNCLCAMVDAIPSSLDIKGEIDRHITEPNEKLAAEIAAWAVQAYRDKIGTERTYGRVAALPSQWERAAMSVEVQLAVENILIKKGWAFGHNFVTNEVYLQPTQPAEKVFRGPAPAY